MYIGPFSKKTTHKPFFKRKGVYRVDLGVYMVDLGVYVRTTHRSFFKRYIGLIWVFVGHC